MRVQKKGDNVVGVVDEVIGNIAIVTYSHHKEKVPVVQLEPAEKRVTKEDYDRFIDETLDPKNINKVYESLMSNKGDFIELPYYAIQEIQDVSRKLFDIHREKLFDDYD